MTKTNLIKDILRVANIHHNIRINFNLVSDVLGESWQMIAEDNINIMSDDWQIKPENDCGNRNLCECRKNNPKNIMINGACKQHDLWHLYTYGRSGATLYWNKYWNESNTRGLYFKEDEDTLREQQLCELKTIHKEIKMFNNAVLDLMNGFYKDCEYRSIEKVKEDKAEAERERAKKQAIDIIKKYGLLKEIISELL